jgi:uncharacterized protein
VQLTVLNKKSVWYEDGLRFTCTQCGNCCTGEPGYVWISAEEIKRLADFLNKTIGEVMHKYCRRVGNGTSLRERKNLRGEHDCIFLEEVAGRRTCTVYPVRPLQCRTWPFWDGNLTSRRSWDRANKKCPGLNKGRHFTREQIEALRDATDWPDKPPTSR